MKIIKTIIILFLIFSCTNENQIAEFESVFGKEKSETLTFLISDFENDFLKNQYPNLSIEESYKHFLYQFAIQDTSNFRKMSNKSEKRFNKNDFRYEINSYVDSAWIEKYTTKFSIKDTILKVKYKLKFKNENNVFDYKISEGGIPSWLINAETDSIIQFYTQRVEVNNSGRYWKALNQVSKKNDFIIDYIDKTKASGGGFIPVILAQQMLKSDLDYSDYFIKRIIVAEFIY